MARQIEEDIESVGKLEALCPQQQGSAQRGQYDLNSRVKRRYRSVKGVLGDPGLLSTSIGSQEELLCWPGRLGAQRTVTGHHVYCLLVRLGFKCGGHPPACVEMLH